MADDNANTPSDKIIAPPPGADNPQINATRLVGGVALNEAEGKRTNASDGSMNKFEQIAAQEASIELIVGGVSVSRVNALTEKQATEKAGKTVELVAHAERLEDYLKHDEQLKGKLSHPQAHSQGAEGIGRHASDLHTHHSERFRNHGQVYTCAMFVNHALADAGLGLHYAKGENHNMVHSLNHALAHDKRFSEVPRHPYHAKVGDVVIFGDHHSGIITSIGAEGPVLTYGGSTQTQKTASTPLKILEASSAYAGHSSHIYRCRADH